MRNYNLLHSTLSIEHQTLSIEHRAPSTVHRASNTKHLYLLILFFSALSFSQRINFIYDEAGNQSSRSVTLASRMTDDIAKNFDNQELLKFFPEDVISYYPNPVRDELYLKWEMVNNVNVQQVDVVNMSGQIIKSFQAFNAENSLNISFNEWTSGVYFVHLNYANGEQKTIKIIKQ
jgi:hypothetical protein